MFFKYGHIVTSDETSGIGRVQYLHYLQWQQKCIQACLTAHAPSAVEKYKDRFELTTTRVSCEFHTDLKTSDEIELRMQVKDMGTNSVQLVFDFYHSDPQGRLGLCASGFQELTCMAAENGELIPSPIPGSFARALYRYSM